MIKQKDGFIGQRAIILPKSIIEEIELHSTISPLYITDIGYYPKANHHYRERNESISQHILIYCTCGSGWYTLDDTTYRIEANQYFILPAGKPHKYGADIENPWTIYWIHFKGTISHIFIPELPCPITILPGMDSRLNYRVNMFEELYSVLELGYSWDNLQYVFSLFHHFMGSLRFVEQFRIYSLNKNDKQDSITSTIHYMKENINKRLSLKQIATYCGYSVSHFSSLFSKSTGHTPLTYFNQLKIQYACQLLDTTDMKINQICFKIGIEDSYYFSRLFTNIMGISPTKYKQLKKG